MNEIAVKQIHEDYSEILSTDAGKRIFGGIFIAAGLNGTHELDGFYQGRRSLGQTIANTIREIDPRLLAECEIAYNDFMRRNDDAGRDDDDGDDYDD